MPHSVLPAKNWYKATSPGEKRRGKGAVPLNLKQYLNRDQMCSLKQMGCFGWELAFVRREASGEPLVVVAKPRENAFGLLDSDGSIRVDGPIEIRDLLPADA